MENLELTILNYLREKSFYEKISPYLDESMLSEEGRTIFSVLKEVLPNSTEKKIKCKDILLAIAADPIVTDKVKNEYRQVLKRVRKSRVDSKEVLLSICKEFLEKHLWKNYLERFTPFLTKRGGLPLAQIEEAMETTRKIRDSFDENKGYNYFENPNRAAVKDSPNSVESPLKGIFLYPGEIGLWGGGPKKGKTWALINTGYSCLIQGKKVVHFTLEISADWVALRYDARILKKPIRDLQLGDSLKAIKKIKLFGGSLIIQDRPQLSLGEIRDYVRSNKVDVVIVDYPDLMTTPRKFKERRHELLSIFQGLRNIAKEFKIPIWAASQLTAKSLSKQIASIEDLEESKIGKAGTSSLFLTINQTPEEKEDGIARIFVAACNRYISGKPLRRVEVDFDTMFLKELAPVSKKDEKD